MSIASYPEGDLPLLTPKQVVLQFSGNGVEGETQGLYFEFSDQALSITFNDDTKAVPNEKVLAKVDHLSRVTFSLAGLIVGTHKVSICAERGASTSMRDFTVSMSDKVYVVEILNAPARRVGEQQDIDFKIVDPKDPQKYFALTPGFMMSVRPLDARASAHLGTTCTWDTLPEFKQQFIPIQWKDNIGGGCIKVIRQA